MTETLAILILCMLLLYPRPFWQRDSTDSKDERSGLVLYTDYQTGCQYVGTPFGSITPRLDKDGKIVCIK